MKHKLPLKSGYESEIKTL